MASSWAILGPSWALLGALLGPSWRPRGRLGPISEPSVARPFLIISPCCPLGPSRPFFAPFWAPLGAVLGPPGASWGPPGGLPGASLGPPRGLLGASWGSLPPDVSHATAVAKISKSVGGSCFFKLFRNRRPRARNTGRRSIAVGVFNPPPRAFSTEQSVLDTRLDS